MRIVASRYRQRRPSADGHCGGSALIGSLMLAVMLATLGFIALTTMSLQSRISGNYLATAQAFYLAEAGHQHAIGLLNAPGGGACDGFDDELTTNGGVMLDAIPFNGGTYVVSAIDNNDDGDPNDDSDDTIILTSDGQIGHASSAIEVVITLGGGGGCGVTIISWRDVTTGEGGCAPAGKIKKKGKAC